MSEAIQIDPGERYIFFISGEVTMAEAEEYAIQIHEWFVDESRPSLVLYDRIQLVKTSQLAMGMGPDGLPVVMHQARPPEESG